METRYNNLTLELFENGDTYTIVSCDKDAEVVEIPFKVNDKLVVGIEDYAFENCTRLRGITFPSSYAEIYFDGMGFSIGEYAFQNCVSLGHIDIPFGVEHILRGAFYGCKNLKNVSLPDCFVGSYAFYNCTTLKRISPLSIISEGVFANCSSLETLPIGTGVYEICEDAFEHCYGLVNITIPKSVTKIEPLAFRGCRNLKKVIFEEPNGWVATSHYTDKTYPLDLSNPEENAKSLYQMDFDDGVGGWYRK